MTATADRLHTRTEPQESGSALSRVPAAFRLQFIVRHTFIYVPLLVFFGTWLAVVGIGLLIQVLNDSPASAADPVYGGVSMASLWGLAFMAAYSVTHTLPFSMALSFSRRAYALGALLTFAVVSAAYGVLFSAAAFVENITDGMGIQHYHFALPFLLDNGGYLGAGFVAFALALFLMLFGFFVAAMYRQLPIMTFWSTGILALLGLAAVVVLLGRFLGWDTMWRWFSEQSTYSIGGWLLLASVALATLAYAILRKTTPTS